MNTHTQTHSPSKFDRISNDKSCVSISSTIYAFSQRNNLSFHFCNTIVSSLHTFHCFLYLCLNFYLFVCVNICAWCVCVYICTCVCVHTQAHKHMHAHLQMSDMDIEYLLMTLHLIPLRQKFYWARIRLFARKPQWSYCLHSTQC